MLFGRKNLIGIPATIPLAFMATGCSLMHDDLDPCAVKPDTHTSVKFKYDYNTRGEDLFASQVGAVTLYIFDEEGRLVTTVERANSVHGDALKSPEFQIDFESDVIQPEQTYTFYAMAHEHPGGYDALLSDAGAAFRRTQMVPGEHGIGDLILSLERDANGLVNHEGKMLNHFWTTLEPFRLEVPEEKVPAEGDPQEEDHYLVATVPLMRVTNKVTVTFWQSDFPGLIDPAHYDIWIEVPKGNGVLDITGKVLDDSAMRYEPYNVETVRTDTGSGEAASIRADFGISRIMLGQEMTLVVRNKNTGNVTRIPELPEILAASNKGFADKNWSDQEYLDREYEYDIKFAFGDPIPKWVDVNVAILSWTYRVQLVDL